MTKPSEFIEITAHMMQADIIVDEPQWQGIPDLADVIKKSMHGVNNIFDDADFCPTSVSFTLTNDNALQKLNKDFRNMDKPTNVLSFPDGDLDEDGRMHIGDIAMAYETMEREATTNHTPLSDHVAHLTIHGLLHLYGYDHETDDEAAEMESIEIEILEDMGIKNPYID